MTPFLIAALLALLAGGGLAVLFREDRRRFRLAALALGGLVLASGAYVLFVSSGIAHQDGSTPLELQDLTLEQVAGSFRVRGSVRNLSSGRAISGLPLHLQVEDCPASGACRLVHEAQQPLGLSVPPQQTRPFVLVFAAAPAHIRGTLRWQVTHGAPTVYVPPER